MCITKLGRLSLGLYGHLQTVCRAAWSGSSWSAVRRQRSLGLQTHSTSQNTVDPEEVRRFQLLASKWWDEGGEFAPLHAMNDLRVPFVRDNMLSVHGQRHPGKPLAEFKILDVGCGGGLLSEPLGRLGAEVLGIDPVDDSIYTAQMHTSYDPDLRDSVSYQACTIEELSENERNVGHFDAIVASEVVEHVADLDTFIFCCKHVLKPGGSLFITTINKTNLSYALGIVVAEQLLGIVPTGTHDWEKFISPDDLERLLESNGFSVQSVRGMLYNPVSGAWCWANSTAINYPVDVSECGLHPEEHSVSARS
uniref:Ubiquinone biosynthesis O-methyltransferase, mitochondrial n=1 Tax=Cynoglossus semilaevis TaxID=244447 RepID=A0A3P8VGL9_CYNSE